jgi:Sulfotransferase family
MRPPVFIGGTGRSGTTITARLLGSHPAYYKTPTESRFISAAGGLCDLAAGRTTLAAFQEAILGRWFHRGPTKGLHLVLHAEQVEAALPILRERLDTDPWAAARAFTRQLLDPLALAAGAEGWIEDTPANAIAARRLLRMFPDMRLVHCVRDGRDVACSVVGFQWGPSDLEAGLEWWAARLERGFRACDRLPPDRVLVVQLEDLVARDRDRQYSRLLEFAHLDDDPAMHGFFADVIDPRAAHIGRWISDVPSERRRAFHAHYARLVAELVARGRPYDPTAGDVAHGAAVTTSA